MTAIETFDSLTRRALVWVVTGLLCGGPAHAAGGCRGDSIPALDPAWRPALEAPAPRPSVFSRDDLAFGLLALGLAGAASTNDVWLTHESTEAHSLGERRLSAVAQPIGNGAVVLAAIATAYGVGRLTGQNGLASSATRIGASVIAAGVSTQALKLAVGRSRPEDVPTDGDEFAPFGGNQSFPSGHAAVAFALAHAIDHETKSRWVPWVVYPMAAAVGWSRVHDSRHWTSDVVGGGMLGLWVSCKTERLLSPDR